MSNQSKSPQKIGHRANRDSVTFEDLGVESKPDMFTLDLKSSDKRLLKTNLLNTDSMNDIQNYGYTTVDSETREKINACNKLIPDKTKMRTFEAPQSMKIDPREVNRASEAVRQERIN